MTRSNPGVIERGFAFYTSHVSDPLPSAVGLAVLETIEREHLLAAQPRHGRLPRHGLRELQSRHEEIGDVRGMGLLRGIELVRDRETREPHHELGALTTQRCLELGLSMNIRRRPERGSVWRIAPPLTVTQGGHRPRNDYFRSGVDGNQRRAGARSDGPGKRERDEPRENVEAAGAVRRIVHTG